MTLRLHHLHHPSSIIPMGNNDEAGVKRWYTAHKATESHWLKPRKQMGLDVRLSKCRQASLDPNLVITYEANIHNASQNFTQLIIMLLKNSRKIGNMVTYAADAIT